MFGGHVDIEVNYKILQLDVPKEFQICTIYQGCFEAVLMKNTPRTLEVNLKYVGTFVKKCPNW